MLGLDGQGLSKGLDEGLVAPGFIVCWSFKLEEPIFLLYYIDGSRCHVAGFGLCLFYLELQLGHFELMLPCSLVFFMLALVFFMFALSELKLILSHSFF